MIYASGRNQCGDRTSQMSRGTLSQITEMFVRVVVELASQASACRD